MSDNKRKLKNSGTTAEVSLDKAKEYKYDKSGALVVATTVGDNDIVFSGSKSSLRRISDLERNVSILAAKALTTDGSVSDSEDDNFDGIFSDPARFKAATRFDAAVDVRAAVAMNSNKITGLGTPSASSDASTKGYVDTTIAAAVQAKDNTDEITEGTTNKYFTDARARSAVSFAAGSGAYNSTTGVISIPTNTNQLTNGAGFITGYTETDTLASVTARGATTTAALSTGALTVSGAITSTGEITAYYSDVNLKKDIVEIAGALDKVEAIRGVHYRPNETALGLGIEDKAEVGVIAQEIEAVLPELVVASAFEGYKTVKYDKLTALLIEAVKELSAKVKTLEAQVGKQA